MTLTLTLTCDSDTDTNQDPYPNHNVFIHVFVQGTLIRVWDAKRGQQLHELRRGMDPADICSVCFSPSSLWLSVSSDKGTVHVFTLKGAGAGEGAAGAAAGVDHDSGKR